MAGNDREPLGVALQEVSEAAQVRVASAPAGDPNLVLCVLGVAELLDNLIHGVVFSAFFGLCHLQRPDELFAASTPLPLLPTVALFNNWFFFGDLGLNFTPDIIITDPFTGELIAIDSHQEEVWPSLHELSRGLGLGLEASVPVVNPDLAIAAVLQLPPDFADCILLSALCDWQCHHAWALASPFGHRDCRQRGRVCALALPFAYQTRVPGRHNSRRDGRLDRSRAHPPPRRGGRWGGLPPQQGDSELVGASESECKLVWVFLQEVLGARGQVPEARSPIVDPHVVAMNELPPELVQRILLRHGR
mmetsp:Transcript_85352/g.198449  ORF Transcript_85352/g.198449 Transcript_85352/m.198449 type:complete len:305 (-) Transcript_85352:60-974(-)